jgi:hypothetical protein
LRAAAKAKAVQERRAVSGCGIERAVQADGLGNCQLGRQRAFLQLPAKQPTQFPAVALGIQPEHPDGATVRDAPALDALGNGRLAGTVGANDPEDLAVLNVERHLVDGDLRPVFLMQATDLDDGHDVPSR